MHLSLKCIAMVFAVDYLVLEVAAVDNITDITADNVTESFTTSGLVPDVLAVAPSGLANVQFTSGAIALLGTQLTPTQVKNEPAVKWNASADLYYTIIFSDPDNASPEWLHWLVVNIPGVSVSNGTTLAQYVGAGPALESGLHRYAFLVYSQPEQLVFNETVLNNTSTYKRTGFSTAAFVTKYNLTEAVAGNFFVAKYDDYVPILYKQLGISKAGVVKAGYALVGFAVALCFLRQ